MVPLVEGFHDGMEDPMAFDLMTHLVSVSTTSKTEKQQPKEVHSGAKPELGESSKAKKEVVSPLPANKVQTSKHRMETTPHRKEKVESPVQRPIPIASTRANSDQESRHRSNWGDANDSIHTKSKKRKKPVVLLSPHESQTSRRPTSW